MCAYVQNLSRAYVIALARKKPGLPPSPDEADISGGLSSPRHHSGRARCNPWAQTLAPTVFTQQRPQTSVSSRKYGSRTGADSQTQLLFIVQNPLNHLVNAEHLSYSG